MKRWTALSIIGTVIGLVLGSIIFVGGQYALSSYIGIYGAGLAVMLLGALLRVAFPKRKQDDH